MVGEWPWSEATIDHGVGSEALAQFAEPAIEGSVTLGDAIPALVAVRGAHAEELVRLEPLPEQVLHGVGFVGVEGEETGQGSRL